MSEETAVAAPAEFEGFTPVENREYAIACAKKQRHLSAGDAEALIEALPDEVRAQVVCAGRSGDVKKVRELLGAS